MVSYNVTSMLQRLGELHMTTVTVSGFKIRKGERLYGTYVRYALYKATLLVTMRHW